jgi:hypothetical protein
MSIYRLMSWMNSGSHQKSEAEIQRLVKDVLQADDFDVKHLEGFSVRRSLRELDKPKDQNGEKVTFPDDWIETNVTISIPTKSAVEGSQAYTVPGFHYRPLVEVIRSAFADVQAGIPPLSLQTAMEGPFGWPSGANNRRAVHLRCLAESSGRCAEAAERAWLFVRTCYSRSYVIFRCHAPRKLWNREGLATLSLFRESNEVRAIDASVGSMPSSRISAFSKFS